MFVSETNIFNPSNIRIKISSMEGVVSVIEVTPDTIVDQLKIGAVSQIYDQRESYKLSLYYRLLHVPSGQVLSEETTIQQAGIKDNDELVLLKKRATPTTIPIAGNNKDQTERVPSVDDIESATADVPSRHVDGSSPKQNSTIEFQKELKKILVSLIDISQKLLCLNPDSIKDARKYVPNNKRKDQTREKSPVDGKALQVLLSMGFDKDMAVKALRICKMSEESAVQWLIDNQSEGAVAANASAALQPADAAGAKTAVDEEADGHQISEESEGDNSNYQEQVFELAKLSGPEKVKHMLAAFQQNRRQEFRPDPRALQSLLEMGFDEDEIIDALRNHGNRQEDACEWLLSRADSVPADLQVEEGLDDNGTIYKAIMSNHIIQLALSNPKTLIALLQILENPNTMQQWLQDPELSPMLLQISRIYHSEKYSQ